MKRWALKSICLCLNVFFFFQNIRLCKRLIFKNSIYDLEASATSCVIDDKNKLASHSPLVLRCQIHSFRGTASTNPFIFCFLWGSALLAALWIAAETLHGCWGDISLPSVTIAQEASTPVLSVPALHPRSTSCRQASSVGMQKSRVTEHILVVHFFVEHHFYRNWACYFNNFVVTFICLFI